MIYNKKIEVLDIYRDLLIGQNLGVVANAP